jgi:hypothetical protein
MDEFEIVPPERWKSFCETFSHEHQGWLVRLWVVNSVTLEAGSAETVDMAIRDLELSSITVETSRDATDVHITTGNVGAHADHHVEKLSALMQEHDADGEPSGLRFDSADGQTTLLRFRPPVEPG